MELGHPDRAAVVGHMLHQIEIVAERFDDDAELADPRLRRVGGRSVHFAHRHGEPLHANDVGQLVAHEPPSDDGTWAARRDLTSNREIEPWPARTSDPSGRTLTTPKCPPSSSS